MSTIDQNVVGNADKFAPWLAAIVKPICDGFGLPTSVCVAQAIEESGWGKHPCGDNNLWGLLTEGTGSPGRNFTSLEEGAEYYCRNMTESGYYNEALKNVGDQDAYIDSMSATYSGNEEGYAQRIKVHISENGLSSYDPKDLKPITPVSSSTKATSGAATKSKDPRGILKFAQFAESLAFTKQMTEGFEQGMEYTLYSYLAKFMQKFYHNLYFIPTLPNNKAIVVKPETMFVDPPSCNVIYPSIKYGLSFSRNPKSEPSRILMISDPVTNIFGMSGGTLSQLVTMAFIEKGDTSVSEKVVGLNSLTNKNRPMMNLTEYEKENGINILRTNQGEDLYLFLVSNNPPKTTTSGKDKVNATVLTTNVDPQGIGQTLTELATYSLLRARYENRQGSCQTYFNPYIVPGFPMLSIEGSGSSSLNVYAYVTDVTHQITESDWSTHIGFTATHIQTEARPPAFPIIENEYVAGLDETYNNMLGPAVTRVTDPSSVRTAYTTSDNSVTSMLKKVWRPLTTMKEHLDTVCDGATVVQERGFKVLQNAEGKSFFSTKIQEKIKAYTQGIMDGNAMHEVDVR